MSKPTAPPPDRSSLDHRDLEPAPVRRSPLAHLRALKPVLTPVRGPLAAVAALTAFGGIAEAAVLIVVAELAVVITGDAAGTPLQLGPVAVDLGDRVPRLLVVAVVCVAVRLITQLASTYLTAHALARIQQDMRSRAFRAFIGSDWATQSAEPDGYLQDLVTIYIARTASSVQILTGALSAAFNFSAMMLGAFLLAPSTAGIILLCVGTLFVVFRPLSNWVRETSGRRAEEGREFARTLSESVNHALEIRTTNVTEEVTDAMEQRAERLRSLEIRTDLLNMTLSPLYQSLAVLALLGALAILYATSSPQVATLGAVLLLLLRAVSYSQGMQTSFHRLNDLAPYAERLDSEMTRYGAAAVPAGHVDLGDLETISLSSVTFSYGRGEPALRDLTVEIEPGEILGMIGASGAGKTTLVQILLGLRSPTEGAYRVNGRSPFEYRPSSWFARVAFVPQEPRLIVGTVADNIRYWREMSDDQVVDAARRAHIHDDIESWPDGYDTRVGPRGSSLSGGQRQRLTIARALAGSPDLLVLDEPTSALDLRSEAMIERTLQELKGEVTMVIITHRLSTVSACDRLLVLDKGRVEGLGRPDEVELSSGFYRDAIDRTAAGPQHTRPGVDGS